MPLFFYKVPSSLKFSLTGAGLGALLFAAYLLFITTHIPVVVPPAQFPPDITLAPALLEAKSAIVYDPEEHRVLFQKDASYSRPLASLTKLMAVQTVLDNSSGDANIVITQSDLKPDGDWGFAAGDVVKLSDLIKMSLVASSNDAMAAAAASLGGDYIGKMNQTAGELGLSHTYFLNSTGLDLTEETSGAYGSAYDVARLAAAFMRQYPQYFELTTQSQVSIEDGTKTLTAKATALPLSSLPGFIGAKTGYTDLAGGNLVAAFDIEVGHPLIAVVLGSSEQGRFNDIVRLINATRAAVATTTP